MSSHGLRVGVSVPDETFGVGDLGGDLLLPGFDVCSREDAVEVGVDESLLLELQGAEAFALLAMELGRVGALGVEDGVGLRACSFDLVRGELHACVPFLLHRLFDAFNRHVGQVAGGAAGVSAEAEEVAVDAAASFGVSVAYPPAAASAGEQAFQWVVVLPGSVSGQPPA